MAENEELDAQTLEEDLSNLEEGQEPAKETEGQEPEEVGTTEPEKPVEPKTFDEDYVKSLRGENAKYRRRARDAEAQIGQSPSTAAPATPPVPGQPGQVYDPRVDDMLLDQKLNSIKEDEYFKELFTDVVDENTGMTFQEKLLETASKEGWPIKELDALVMKMERKQLLGGAKQRGIDETYKSLKQKSEGSAVKNVASGKPVSTGGGETLDDALNKTMEELGVDDISKI